VVSAPLPSIGDGIGLGGKNRAWFRMFYGWGDAYGCGLRHGSIGCIRMNLCCGSHQGQVLSPKSGGQEGRKDGRKNGFHLGCGFGCQSG